jgi:uncharacterized protein DUF3352
VDLVRFPSRLVVLPAALAAATVLAACGGAELGGAGGSTPEGAELLAAGTPVFVTINGNVDSGQWQAAQALLQRFPSGQETIDSILGEITDGGAQLETDVLPALGPEVDIAVLDLPQDGDPAVVMLTQPTDPSKLEKLLTEADEAPVWREVDGWYVVADSEENIDRALNAGGDSLADSNAFEEAMGGLPDETLARVYLDGPALLEAVAAGAKDQGGLGQLGANPVELLGSGDKLEYAALALLAEEQGLRVEGVARSEQDPGLEPAAAELPGLVPADVLLYGSFNGLDQGLSQLLETMGKQTPDFDRTLAQLELVLGVSVDDDLLPIFAGEGALYVRAGAPIPEVTLVLSPDDPAKAGATLDKLVAAASLFGPGGEGGMPPFTVTDTTIAGVAAKKLEINDQVSVYYATVDDHLVVTTAVKGIADLVAGGASLADDPLFQEARDTAGTPDETLGFVYVNLERAVGFADTLGMLDGEKPELAANLKPLRYLLVDATGDGAEAQFSGFLGIR